MDRRSCALALLALVAPVGAAGGGEPEGAAVGRRLHALAGQRELTAFAGLTPVDFLTDHKDLALGLGYNLTEQLALELEGARAFSSHTGAAQSSSRAVASTDPAKAQGTVDDFSDLWRLTWSATLALRWTPVYGKVSLASELPVHFQVYLLAGAGVGWLVRDSLVYCVGTPTSRPDARCDASSAGATANDLTPLHETAVRPLAALGAGLRLFLGARTGLRVEVRDLAFADSYRVGIDRAAAERDLGALAGGAPSQGRRAASPGISHVVFARLGAVISF